MAVVTEGPVAFGERAGRLAQLTGAAVSLALVVGVGVWGYRLMVRDATGIPVVRAMEGPMRIAPDDPGGDVAANRGLAVNAIAAVGEAAPPEDTLLLAPQTAGLTPEDMEVQTSPEADEVLPEEASVIPAVTTEPMPAEDGALTAEQILALADQIAARTTPLEPLAALPATPLAVIPASVPGLSRTMVPLTRPVQLAAVVAPAAADAAPAAPAPVEIAVDLPPGTVLIQLGVYPTAQAAAADWDRALVAHAAFLADYSRVIQAAESGGEGFFRLRATGFADMAEARSLCTALRAEDQPCTPSLVP